MVSKATFCTMLLFCLYVLEGRKKKKSFKMQKKRNVFGKKRVRNIIEGFLFSPQSSFYVLGSWACNKFTYNYASLSAPEAS